MSTSTYSEPLSQYTEVKKDQIVPGQHFPTSKVFNPHEVHREKVVLAASLLETGKVEPSQRISKAVEMGKEMIRQYYQDLGLPLNVESMEVVFLPPSVYDKYLSGTLGIALPGVNAVFVKLDPEIPDHLTASFAFHELIHRWIDRHHTVFHLEPGSDPEESTTQEILFENRRSGLQIKRLIRDTMTGKTIREENVGEFLNELGNFTWENLFTHRLLSSKSMQPMFEDEIKSRDSKLQEIFGDTKSGSVDLTINDENGREVTVRIGGRNLFWDKRGELTSTDLTLISQLVSELDTAVGEIDMKLKHLFNIPSALIRCKVDPEYQKYLKKAIDEKLGAGFYLKLRRTNYRSKASILDILTEVQNR